MTLTIRTLRLADYLPLGAAYHIARVTLRASEGPRAPHDHDFAEAFWVERGSGSHLVNRVPTRLEEDDLVLVRPEDAHALRPDRAADLTIVNVAFERETLEFLGDRYFQKGGWPWQGSDVPARYRLVRTRLREFGELASRLVAGPPTRLLLERFLLELLHELAEPPVHPELPPWAEEAIRRFAEDREALARGVGGLATLAGRSREHVNRVLRAHTGRTATETVNEIRLLKAALDLRMTDRSIALVAVDCGLPNLSYFYRLFKGKFGITPRQYRLGHQILVRGG